MDNAAINKDLEANGRAEETRSESDSSTSEQLNPYRKRSRRMEYLYISIAVVLGAALIAVLVYFSVINAAKDEPEAVASKSSASTTPDYDYLFGDVQDDGDNNFGGGGQITGNTRNAPIGGISRSADPPAETTTKRSLSLVGSNNNGGNPIARTVTRDPNPILQRRMMPPQTTTTTTRAPRMALRGLQRRMPPPSDTDGDAGTPTDTAGSDGATEAKTDPNPILQRRMMPPQTTTTTTSAPRMALRGLQRRMPPPSDTDGETGTPTDTVGSDGATEAKTEPAVKTTIASPTNDAGSQRELRILTRGGPIMTGNSAQGGDDKSSTQSPDNDGGDGGQGAVSGSTGGGQTAVGASGQETGA